ncbi:hypothetical protein L1049_003315 [Liquidambar formosana]|uniref:Uncharacterized protein n=1 Tax=Liquidambar formosana TaxID=63359 RepID=A0AAP0NJ48_LIQFO
MIQVLPPKVVALHPADILGDALSPSNILNSAEIHQWHIVILFSYMNPSWSGFCSELNTAKQMTFSSPISIPASKKSKTSPAPSVVVISPDFLLL